MIDFSVAQSERAKPVTARKTDVSGELQINGVRTEGIRCSSERNRWGRIVWVQRIRDLFEIFESTK